MDSFWRMLLIVWGVLALTLGTLCLMVGNRIAIDNYILGVFLVTGALLVFFEIGEKGGV